MNSITQDMRYRLSLITYAGKHGCSVTIDVTPTTIQKRLSPIEF